MIIIVKLQSVMKQQNDSFFYNSALFFSFYLQVVLLLSLKWSYSKLIEKNKEEF